MDGVPKQVTVVIKYEDKEAKWSLASNELKFNHTLLAISRLLPNVVVTAFEYEDDEGDRITVRSDDELQTMFLAYNEETRGDFDAFPLVIYPRVGKRPQDRNVHRLKIQTKAAAPNLKGQTLPEATDADDVRGNLIGDTAASAHERVSVLAPSQLQFLNHVGSGCGGSVYRTLHKPSGIQMAVKLIQLDISPVIQKQILREYKILDQCSCPSVITCYGTFFVDNQMSICTEYMDGGSLDRYGQVPQPVLGRVTVRIVQGLLYLWSKKIMHRDIKPSNILVNTAGDVKLCDFGVSIQMVNTMAKTYIGTNAYMSPERILGEDYSLPAEVWSLGVTLFELATGQFPYVAPESENQPMALLSCILNEEPPRLSPAYFTTHLIDFVTQCMKHKPACRLKGDKIELFVEPHWLPPLPSKSLAVVVATTYPDNVCLYELVHIQDHLDISSVDYENFASEALENLSDLFDDLPQHVQTSKEYDVVYADGVLTVTISYDFGTYVINKQSASKQIWYSSPVRFFTVQITKIKNTIIQTDRTVR